MSIAMEKKKSEQYCTHWKIPYARSTGGRDVGDEAIPS